MGHGQEDQARYTRQALHANISSLHPELLQELNQLIVNVGHQGGMFSRRAANKVCLTIAEFPTDIRLLWNACTSLIAFCVSFAKIFGLSGWRQHQCIRQRLTKRYKHAVVG